MSISKDTTVKELKLAIRAFDTRRAAIFAKAHAEGGAALMNRVIDEYNVLRDAAFELTARQLDANHAAYQGLMADCKAETAALKASIASLQRTADILNSAAKLVGLVGRILIVLGV